MVVAAAVTETVRVRLAVGVAGDRVGRGVRLQEREELWQQLPLRVADGEAERVVPVPEGADGVAVAEGVWAAEAEVDGLVVWLLERVGDGGLAVAERLGVPVRLREGGDAVRDGVRVRVREAVAVGDRLRVGGLGESVGLADPDADARAEALLVPERVREPVRLRVGVPAAVLLRVALGDRDRDSVGLWGLLGLGEWLHERLPEGLRVPVWVPLRVAVAVDADTEALRLREPEAERVRAREGVEVRDRDGVAVHDRLREALGVGVRRSEWLRDADGLRDGLGLREGVEVGLGLRV